MKKMKLINKIISALKTINGEDPKIYRYLALELSKNHFMIDETCKIYQLLLDAATNEELLKLYQ